MSDENQENPPPEEEAASEETSADAPMDEGTDVIPTELADEGSETVHDAHFAPLDTAGEAGDRASNFDLLLDVTVTISAEMGQKSLPLERILQLKPGSVVELEKPADEPIDLLVNGKPIARGEVVVVDDHFGVRVVEILRNDRHVASMTDDATESLTP